VPNTSATGGALLPTGNPLPLADLPLQDFLHDWIVGITGFTNALVRPRWQPEQPNIPNASVDWCAFGVTNKHTLGQPYIEHVPASTDFPNGYDELRSHQEFTMLVTFYGPNAEMNEMLLSRGMYIAQNQESLNLNNMALIGHEDSTTIPELLKEQWMFRVDLPIYFRRQITLDYSVLNILHGIANINNEHSQTPITSG